MQTELTPTENTTLQNAIAIIHSRNKEVIKSLTDRLTALRPEFDEYLKVHEPLLEYKLAPRFDRITSYVFEHSILYNFLENDIRRVVETYERLGLDRGHLKQLIADIHYLSICEDTYQTLVIYTKANFTPWVYEEPTRPTPVRDAYLNDPGGNHFMDLPRPTSLSVSVTSGSLTDRIDACFVEPFSEWKK